MSDRRICKICGDYIFYSKGDALCKQCRINRYRAQGEITNSQDVNDLAWKQEQHRLRKYGIDRIRYYEMLGKQNYSCAICCRVFEFSGNDRSRAVCVDHNHSTSEVRGLLCTSCNTGLGLFGDDARRLERAVIYMRGAERNQKENEFPMVKNVS
jgi:hypothetical protein